MDAVGSAAHQLLIARWLTCRSGSTSSGRKTRVVAVASVATTQPRPGHAARAFRPALRIGRLGVRIPPTAPTLVTRENPGDGNRSRTRTLQRFACELDGLVDGRARAN